MPILSTAQLAYIRAVKSDNYPDALDVYAPPAVVNKKRGDYTLAAASQACRRWPASRAPQVLAKIPDIGAARVDELIFFPDRVTTIARGGELRSSTGEKLKIEGVGTWQTTIAVAASLVSPS
jgi:hypothetical protein